MPPFDVVIVREDFAGAVEDGLATDANALWLFAVLAGVASVCVLDPVTSRYRWGVAEQDEQLSALGWARGERVARGASHAAVIWFVAAAVSSLVMVVASTQSPVGDGRTIESPSSLELDSRVLALGLLGLYRPTGFGYPYFTAIATATALGGFAGVLFVFRLLRSYFDESAALPASFLIWLATSHIWYMVFEPSMSHAFAMAAVAGLWRKIERELAG